MLKLAISKSNTTSRAHLDYLLYVLALAGLFFVTNWSQSFAQEQTALNPPLPDTLSEKYREWEVRCTTIQNTSLVCELRQELTMTENNQRILAVAIQAIKDDDGATMTLISPLGMWLEDGINIAIGEEPSATIIYRTCVPGGCLAQSRINGSIVGSMIRSDEAQFTMTSNSGQPITVAVSLDGFSAGWNRIQELPH